MKAFVAALAASTFALPAAAQSAYVVGLTGALTGPPSSTYAPAIDALRIYIDRINAAGGVNGHKIDLILEDDGAQPSKAAANTKKLISQDNAVLLSTRAFRRPMRRQSPKQRPRRCRFYSRALFARRAFFRRRTHYNFAQPDSPRTTTARRPSTSSKPRPGSRSRSASPLWLSRCRAAKWTMRRICQKKRE